MPTTPRKIPRAVILVIGLAAGWGIDHLPRSGSVVLAHGGDRSGESILASGPVMLGYNDKKRVQIPLEAIYYLDYKAGRLLATIPSFKQSVGAAKLIDSFAERDLVADFKINLDSGPRPQFLMTTGSLGTYSEGWAPLFVFETTTSQVAVYKVEQQMVGAKTTPKFELMELQALPAAIPPPEPR
ncbi:hypothetical protein [Singulisphaera acidiphila]|uniref:Uncharacterized protein n=1 Tax=Singulisphaera acidiphila (strain ATCC BAA-1392 / DSM 18658 / VKM B-2454 / MOB10) TaxID=886293 RepID=L0DKM9_SINAD|nr:hypothetical protein [Singulisphaera acidiphila]AGA29398.1 hypothetical protein Sinac_5246 [Singulisphaera acidiphila DSM 18658]